jgi:hypothetical protein
MYSLIPYRRIKKSVLPSSAIKSRIIVPKTHFRNASTNFPNSSLNTIYIYIIIFIHI